MFDFFLADYVFLMSSKAYVTLWYQWGAIRSEFSRVVIFTMQWTHAVLKKNILLCLLWLDFTFALLVGRLFSSSCFVFFRQFFSQTTDVFWMFRSFHSIVKRFFVSGRTRVSDRSNLGHSARFVIHGQDLCFGAWRRQVGCTRFHPRCGECKGRTIRLHLDAERSCRDWGGPRCD